MKNYRIVRLAGMNSQAAMQQLYENYATLSQSSYAQQQKVIFDNAYMYSDTFSKEMRKLGHEAEEIVYDVEPLQMRWMEEQGSKVESKNWRTEIVLAQLAKMRPEIVFFQDIHALPLEVKQKLKELVPSIRKIVIFRGFPGIDRGLFQELAVADLLLVGSPILVDRCREQGLNPHLAYHFFDTSILERLKMGEKKIPFSFIGSSGFGYEAHRDRYHMLMRLLEKTNIELWIDEPRTKITWKAVLADAIRSGLSLCPSSLLERLEHPARLKKLARQAVERKRALKSSTPEAAKPLRQLFPGRCRDPLFGLQMFEMLQQSKLVLNRHSMPAEGFVDNIRLFQTTGVGSCLLTDTGNNMRDLFEPDREIVTYSSFDECIEKANYLLNHEKEMAAIADAGQKRTLKDHNATVRYGQVNALIQPLFF